MLAQKAAACMSGACSKGAALPSAASWQPEAPSGTAVQIQLACSSCWPYTAQSEGHSCRRRSYAQISPCGPLVPSTCAEGLCDLVMVFSEDTVVCSAGVLAASSGMLQLRDQTSRSASLLRLPHGSAQHEVQSLATAQPTTCVLMPSPQHLLAAGAAPASDWLPRDMLLNMSGCRDLSFQE